MNNVEGSLNLIEASVNSGVEYFVFSSSAAVYGNPVYTPIDEKHPTNPKNPYGDSKLISENIIKQYCFWKKINCICLRYFNVIGNYYSEPLNKHGLPYNLLTCLKNKKDFVIFGKDYNTKDGTPLRDYINV